MSYGGINKDGSTLNNSAASCLFSVFDLLGRRIRVLVHENQNQGMKQIAWDGKDLRGNAVASGIYIYQLEAGHFVQSRKMILLK